MGCVSAALGGLSRCRAVWFKQELSCPATARLRSSPHKAEDTHGHQTERLSTDAPSAEGIVHRRGVAGPDHRGAGACTYPRRACELRARRAYGVAHPSPLGQTLHVISGVGRVQAKDGPIREIK